MSDDGLSPAASRWEVQVSLESLVPATIAGLMPTEFMMRTELQNASVYPGTRILPRSAGGRGYVCCGAVHQYLLPDAPHTHAPYIQLKYAAGLRPNRTGRAVCSLLRAGLLMVSGALPDGAA